MAPALHTLWIDFPPLTYCARCGGWYPPSHHTH